MGASPFSTMKGIPYTVEYSSFPFNLKASSLFACSILKKKKKKIPEIDKLVAIFLQVNLLVLVQGNLQFLLKCFYLKK